MSKDKNLRACQPREMVEGIYSFSASEMDIIDMVLSKMTNETETEENRLRYTLQLSEYIPYMNIKKSKDSKRKQYDKFRKTIKKMYDRSFRVYDGNANLITFRILSLAKYNINEGSITVELSGVFKELLNEIKKTRKSRIFYSIRYTLPMKSQYSKRLYYMFCQWIGKQMITTPEKLRTQLEISDKYGYGMFKKTLLLVQ